MLQNEYNKGRKAHTKILVRSELSHLRINVWPKTPSDMKLARDNSREHERSNQLNGNADQMRKNLFSFISFSIAAQCDQLCMKTEKTKFHPSVRTESFMEIKNGCLRSVERYHDVMLVSLLWLHCEWIRCYSRTQRLRSTRRIRYSRTQ